MNTLIALVVMEAMFVAMGVSFALFVMKAITEGHKEKLRKKLDGQRDTQAQLPLAS
ncbi:MAG: hypothetical protein ACYCY2_12435 [Acidithiobacillus ferriphilus]